MREAAVGTAASQLKGLIPGQVGRFSCGILYHVCMSVTLNVSAPRHNLRTCKLKTQLVPLIGRQEWMRLFGCLSLRWTADFSWVSRKKASPEQKPLLHTDSAIIMQKGFLFMLPQLVYTKIKCHSAAQFHTGPRCWCERSRHHGKTDCNPINGDTIFMNWVCYKWKKIYNRIVNCWYYIQK